ncbi:MAG: aminopeptidase P family protein [Bauldia sp.]|nr:aminopeptidase P family protein [Bauldia sp.]
MVLPPFAAIAKKERCALSPHADSTSHRATRDRLERLRALLRRDGLTGFIVPHADEHQSEYLPPAAERLAWLTGFTGSAGAAVVLPDAAALFVDGRYTLQAAAHVDPESFSREHLIENPPSKWLASRLRPGDRIGYDPWLMTAAEVRRLEAVCKAAEASLVPVRGNPIDRIWEDRPAPPLGAVSIQPADLAGEEAADKLARLRAGIAEARADAAVLAQADSIAWSFNLRGADIAHNPVALAYAILPVEGRPSLFVDGRKLSNSVRTTLADLAELHEPTEFTAALAALGHERRRVLLDPKSTSAAIADAVSEAGGTVVDGPDPAELPKARKNATELAGMHRAHVRDGAAMVRFLAWLDRTAGDGSIDELAAEAKLAAFRADTARRDGAELVDLSFDTISGAGPNGAIVHYRVSEASNRRLEPGTLYLVDSGGQYRDGTTDITRTVAIGAPSEEMRDRFTRVLRGHIAIATARFPVGASGAQLDTLARAPLWQAGLDYDHGTGHGVGAFLAVHEGPARISKAGTVPLEAGMVLSDEPGYYKAGAFGIRIENLVIVTPAEPISGGDRPMHGFETLTLAPIDRRLIDPALMTAAEIAWVDAYHARLVPALSHLLDAADRAWLDAATAPIASRQGE